MNQKFQNGTIRSTTRSIVIISFAFFSLLAGQAQQIAGPVWPQFRGPNGSGVYETAALPKDVGPDVNVIWKRQIPVGYSSPVLNEKFIFLTAIDEGKLLTICLNRFTGETIWQREAPRPREEPIDNRNNPASPTATIDENSVYVFFPDFGLLAYDFRGQELWKLPLGPFHNGYGMGASPVVAGDKVVLVCDQTFGSFIIAVDKQSGRVAWKKDRPEAKSGHSTPILYQPETGELQVIIPGSFLLIAYSADTGERLWWIRGLACEMKATPVIFNGMVFTHGFGMPQNDYGNQVVIPAFDEALVKFDANKDGLIDKEELPKEEPYNQVVNFDLKEGGKLDQDDWNYFRASLASVNAILGIRLGGSGDMTDSGTAWRYYRRVPQLPSPLVYRDKLYVINDIGFVTILNPADGTVIKEGRLTGGGSQFYASPVGADGKIYFISRGGKVSVLNADGTTDISAISDLKEECYATPTIADGRLYIRTVGTLYCFGGK
ncbi:MAG: PQQ-binding-like beta-propeller repeat protein [Bacteroidia bacterium]|nr:PQQ-binding-like beta-propeller repeat protein [Bacteroidia bacterium]